MKRLNTGLLRSMPLRLALALVVLFSLMSLVGLAASYLYTQRSLDQVMRADLKQDMAGFRAAPTAAALALLVEAEAKATDPERLILSYFAPNRQHFGNAVIGRDEDGYHIVSLSQNDDEALMGRYLALTTPLKGGVLTIARSRDEILGLRSVFLNILGLSLLPTILLALSGGLYLARRSARHVALISENLDRLTNGHYDTRIGATVGWSDDLVQIGRKIDKMAQAQQSSVAALRQVSSDIAHDLKTPIQRVALLLDDLSGHQGLDPKASALVTSAQDEIKGIVSVFQSLLQIAQTESGALRNQFKAVDLGAVCHTFCEIYDPVAAEKNMELTFQTDGQDRYNVQGDRHLLGQLLANLIENAMTHAADGGHIKVALERDAGAVVLTVSDKGPGIPADKRDLVLRRLYRLDRSRSTPGNGLGLSLVKVVADLHSADLSLLDNAPGLVVQLRFPGA